MAYYKIKNVTNTLGKRDSKLNTKVTVDFKNMIGSNVVSIESGAEIVVESSHLPVSAQKLRAEGMINVIEIDRNAYQNLLNSQDHRIANQPTNRPLQPAKVGDSEEKSKKYKEKIK